MAKLLGCWWLKSRASTRDVIIRLTAEACAAQRLSNRKPETRIELVEVEGGRCEIEHVDVEAWTEEPAEFVLLKSRAGKYFRMRMRRDMLEGFRRPGE